MGVFGLRKVVCDGCGSRFYTKGTFPREVNPRATRDEEPILRTNFEDLIREIHQAEKRVGLSSPGNFAPERDSGNSTAKATAPAEAEVPADSKAGQPSSNPVTREEERRKPPQAKESAPGEPETKVEEPVESIEVPSPRAEAEEAEEEATFSLTEILQEESSDPPETTRFSEVDSLAKMAEADLPEEPIFSPLFSVVDLSESPVEEAAAIKNREPETSALEKADGEQGTAEEPAESIAADEAVWLDEPAGDSEERKDPEEPGLSESPQIEKLDKGQERDLELWKKDSPNRRVSSPSRLATYDIISILPKSKR